VLFLSGCIPLEAQQDTTPRPVPEGSPCAQMCEHIGPNGLGCEEGQPVYDSDVAGPPGVPNESCVTFCNKQLDNGVDIFPECIARVKSCDEIEDARFNCGGP
jgi:hypothetical protein